MTLLYYSPRFLEHNTGNHPERSARLPPSVTHLEQFAATTGCKRPSWTEIEGDRLSQVHSTDYIESVRQFAKQGGGSLEQDTIVSPRSYHTALLAAGAVCDAVTRVLDGQDKQAFCLLRPPGHHALPNAAMGFCLFNNVATGARLAVDEFGLDRVMIVDWDVHHGNGTQASFWEDERVGFFSTHRSPFYPGTGAADETGGGAGLGATCNLPVKFGTPRSEYLKMFVTSLERFARLIKPQLIFISAGFDSHREDPIGSLGLESEDFQSLTEHVLEIAAVHASGRVISVLEGGYNPQALAESVNSHLQGLLVGSGFKALPESQPE